MTTPAQVQRGLSALVEAQRLQGAGAWQEAGAAYNRALAALPNHPAVLESFARFTEQARDWKNAETLWRRLAALRPSRAAMLGIARALGQQGRHEDALALTGSPGIDQDAADVLLLRATALSQLGRWEESLVCSRAAWARHKDAAAMELMLVACSQLGDGAALDTIADDALARFPGSWRVRSTWAQHSLKSGRDLARAFACFPDIRRNLTGDPAPYDTDAAGRRWDGVPFDGTLRVVADAGLGDQLLGASMLPDLVRLGQRTRVLCDPRLVTLFSRSFSGIEFLPRDADGEARALTGFDHERDRRINLLDLGEFFRRSTTAFPIHPGWLRIDEVRRSGIDASYAARWPGLHRIGIAWHSTRAVAGLPGKGIALADFAPLLRLPGCAFVSLQYGDLDAAMASLAAVDCPVPFVDPDIDATNDLDALCAQVAALDLVITTSNTTAHVAGALGVPCVVLLPSQSPVLWYWGYRGERTPWYPNTRLRRGDPATLVAGIVTDVASGAIFTGFPATA